MAWQPQEEGLKQILMLLKLSMTPDNAAQKVVQEQFELMIGNPEFCKYLMFVVARLPHEDEIIRSRSCLNVKNIIKRYTLNSDVLEYVKHSALATIGDPSCHVRKSVGTLMSTILATCGSSSWPQLLPTLYSLLDSDDVNACEGAMNALQKICEDCEVISKGIDFPMNHFMAKFVQFLGHNNSKIRTCAATCINSFILYKNPAFKNNLDYFMTRLFELAIDNDVEVCQQVCRAFVMLLDQNLDSLLPHMNSVIEYMISKTREEDPVALEACEFWHCMTEQSMCRETLRPYLPKLIPVLIDNMKFTDMEIMLLKGDAEDELVEDRDEDIKPRFHRSKIHQATNTEGSEDICSDGDDDDDEMLNEWNIRKSSAAALDALANIFKDELLPIMLPILKELLFHRDWIVKESGILALGAISQGCMNGIAPHLNELIPYLITCMSNKRSLIRVITCWTLSRYYDWALSDSRNSYLEPILSELLPKMLDPNKKVQESACSALAKLEEVAGTRLVIHLDVILRTFLCAHAKYQHKSLTLLYDAIGTLASFVGSHLNHMEHINLLMPPLIDKWNKTGDDDKSLLCLFECLTAVAVALKMGFIPYTEPVYNRCLVIIEKTLNEQMARENDPKNSDLPEPKIDFLTCSLDLISGLISAINGQMESLITNSNCLQLLFRCMQNCFPEVRQSSFSLLGDMARNCYNCIYPCLGDFIPIVIFNINAQHLSVCNNATWAIGEISQKMTGAQMQPYVDSIIKQLLHVIHSGNRILSEISAIALGRIGNICPNEIGSVLGEFSKLWCASAGNIRDRYEKESTFRGICQVIMTNPYGIDLYYFCIAIISWDDPGENLRDVFKKILLGFKTQGGEENWEKFLQLFSDQFREKLAQYQI